MVSYNGGWGRVQVNPSRMQIYLVVLWYRNLFEFYFGGFVLCLVYSDHISGDSIMMKSDITEDNISR